MIIWKSSGQCRAWTQNRLPARKSWVLSTFEGNKGPKGWRTLHKLWKCWLSDPKSVAKCYPFLWCTTPIGFQASRLFHQGSYLRSVDSRWILSKSASFCRTGWLVWLWTKAAGLYNFVELKSCHWMECSLNLLPWGSKRNALWLCFLIKTFWISKKIWTVIFCNT